MRQVQAEQVAGAALARGIGVLGDVQVFASESAERFLDEPRHLGDGKDDLPQALTGARRFVIDRAVPTPAATAFAGVLDEFSVLQGEDELLLRG